MSLKRLHEIMISDLDDETPELPNWKIPASTFGTFSSKAFDSFVDEAPSDILKMIENIHRRNRIDEIAKNKYNTARNTVFDAHTDFKEYVKDMEDYMVKEIIHSIDGHNDFEQVTRHALNEVFFTTNTVMSYMDNRKNTALPVYADLCEKQADRIKYFRDMIEGTAFFIIDTERE